MPISEARTDSATAPLLDCGGVTVELVSDDPAVVDYALEYFDPWFRPTTRNAEWLVTVTSSASAYADVQRRRPAEATPQPCFAHDRQVMSMPAWDSGGAVEVCDAERSCFLRIRPGRVDLIADPNTRRWRFTLLWIVQEIAATKRRRTHVDAHAASVHGAGRALLICGPKNAGKTTVSFYLMRTLGCDAIANDRSFIGGEAASLVVEGLPTAVKIRPPTLDAFPELAAGLPPVARPYLYTLAELEVAAASDERPETVDFALTPNQIAARFGVRARAGGPLGAIVFPQICASETPWALEPMSGEEIVAAIHANLYGAASRERPETLFERFAGGHCKPSSRLVAAIGAAVAGYRLRLGPDAYRDATLGERLLRLLAS